MQAPLIEQLCRERHAALTLTIIACMHAHG
ncbi:hypothetical protein Mal4_51710 [Maioricimonas rarisocia]|uniref:Uncharacterized protein n=1 Tax=Maioricimonas rarisocia TaxID=2528026 RepID=A0A517ZEA0_9PLAN|nr:hypothetical protein Mal4_51710 [Maioricimonas rarisocia]